jgi:putative FmdB family regulatory protein
MPRYDYQCRAGHVFERYVPLAEFDYAQRCECGEIAAQIFTAAPAVIGFESKTAMFEQAIYRQHNVTRRTESPGVTALPNSPGDQCGCGKCSSHRKRQAVTATAEPGKDR